MSNVRTQPSLADLVDLARQADQDAASSDPALRHRDRDAGRRLEHLEHRPVAQVLAWLDGVRPTDRADRVDTLHRAGLALLALAGLLAGWGAAAVIFYYDGTHPVNVVHGIAVFVLLPVLTLLGFCLGLLPRRVTRWVPGLAAVQDALGLLSPGRVQHLLARWLPQRQREAAASWIARGQAHARLYGRVDRWVVVQSTQVFALAFHVGALASALYLVVFSDLAFAWSTTLETDATGLRNWTDPISAPWAWAWSDARPSLALIEQTRYFRFGEGSFPDAPSARGLGGWWPFLVMCLAVYGVLPRVATLTWARLRLRRALRLAVLHFPGVDAVRTRLNSELVETRADRPDAGGGRDGVRAAPVDVGGVAEASAVVVAWAGAAADRETVATWLHATAGLEISTWHEAGGARSLADDRVVVGAVASCPDGPTVLARAWEPPMAEFLDFLRELRNALGDGRTIAVLPLGGDGSGTPVAADARHVDVWRRALGRLGDPWLRVLHPGGDAS